MTNYERIRNMSVEELARKLICWDDGYGCWYTNSFGCYEEIEDAIKDEIEWLLQEAE